MAEVALRDGQCVTYSGSISGLVGVSGDILTFTASTTNGRITRLTHLSVTGVATAATDTVLTLVKRSTLDTAGTGAAVTVTPHVTSAPTPTTAVTSYTAAPTPGTIIGTALRVSNLTLALAATGQANAVTWEFGARPAQCPQLVGISTTQICLAVSSSVAGALYYIDFEFTEDAYS